MCEQTVAMYCFLDDLLLFTRPSWARSSASSRRFSHAQVLTTALVAARFFGGNLVVAKHYMEQHWDQRRGLVFRCDGDYSQPRRLVR